ncbi:hypothetical protein [Vibrio barjaei]|uniref:hypothetical protein n=1 Tax=Vibrio barjaei TaxID=1676683 RepID=UPI00228517AA|nr:hypothetical protein [Vibrio barjaei]MCY9871765.1 hypothetical protein [Vibrio barjaei]
MDQLTLQECLIDTLRRLEKYKSTMCLREDAYDLESTIKKLTEQLFSLQILSELKGSIDDVSSSIELLQMVTKEAERSLAQGFELDDARKLIAHTLEADRALSKVTLGELGHI